MEKAAQWLRSHTPPRLMHLLSFGKAVLKGYSEDHGSLVAAAVSFYVFTALVPLLLLGIAIGAYILGSPAKAEHMILSAVKSGAPQFGSQAGLDVLKGTIDQIIAGRGVATGFGLLSLLWTGTAVFANLEQAVNVAWGVEPRSFIKKRIIAVGMLLLVGVLLGASVGLSAAVSAIRTHHISVFGISPANWLLDIFGYLIPLVLSIATYTAFYKITPNTSVGWGVALIGGVFAGILWEAAKYVFSYYVRIFADYNKVYGSLAGIILILVWIYVSAIVIILGTEVASVYAGRRDRRREAFPQEL